MPANNVWQGFLDENPQAAYFGYQGQFGTSPNQRRFFQDQYANIHNQYLGQLGQQIMGGGAPSLNFTDFLKDYNFGQQYAQQTPRERGIDTSRFNPFTRWNL